MNLRAGDVGYGGPVWNQRYTNARPSLARALIAATGSYAGVEDAIQAGFIHVMRRAPADPRSIEGAVFAAALSELHARRRFAGVRRRLGIGASAPALDSERSFQRTPVAAALESLDPRERELIVAKHYVGMSAEEIAAHMHFASSRVASKLARAADRFRSRDPHTLADMTASHDALAHRLVTALDMIALPAGLERLSSPAGRSRLRDPRLIAFAALLVLVTSSVAVPTLTERGDELTRWVTRVLFGPAWVGYYIDQNATDASGASVSRLRFASSDGTSTATRPDIIGPTLDHGQWSPDREQLTVSSATKIYVADRRGNLREIADVGPAYVVVSPAWIGSDRVFGLLRPSSSTGSTGAPWSYITVDLSTGARDIRALDSPLPGHAYSVISPDGRWLPVLRGRGPCGQIHSLYDLQTHQLVEVVDAKGRAAAASVGFLSGNRLVTWQCDRSTSTLEIYIGAPGTTPVLLATVSDVFAPRVETDSGNDEILVFSATRDGRNTATVFDTTGRIVRTFGVPQLTVEGSVAQVGLSRDGLFFSFVLTETRNGLAVGRVGVVDLTSGQVTFLCDAGCWFLLIR